MTTPGGTKICKICGVEYPYCHTNIPTQYRWQDVACCKEHAAEYFAAIAASRNESLDTIPEEYTSLLKPNTKVSEQPKEEVHGFVEMASADTVTEDIVDMVGARRKPKRKYFDYE